MPVSGVASHHWYQMVLVYQGTPPWSETNNNRQQGGSRGRQQGNKDNNFSEKLGFTNKPRKTKTKPASTIKPTSNNMQHRGAKQQR
jgi:hypothetical protein